jgi:nucleotide-binding universal stress UspA family protein
MAGAVVCRHERCSDDDATRDPTYFAVLERRSEMTLPTNILVPTDFSETADRALDYAIALSAPLGARIHVVHVIGIPQLGIPELGVALTSTMIESLVRDNQAALDRLVDKHRGQATFGDIVLRTGDARDMILQAANEVHADLIVIGTHGRRGLARALLGSVAEAIVRMAPCPVLTVGVKTAKP